MNGSSGESWDSDNFPSPLQYIQRKQILKTVYSIIEKSKKTDEFWLTEGEGLRKLEEEKLQKEKVETNCESWDSDNFPCYNPLQDIQRKNILRSASTVIGKSKKIKKEFRLAERERLLKLDEEEKLQNKKNEIDHSAEKNVKIKELFK